MLAVLVVLGAGWGGRIKIGYQQPKMASLYKPAPEPPMVRRVNPAEAGRGVN